MPPTASSSADGVPSSGKFYQNVPEIDGPGNDTAAGAVAVINPHNMKVERLFPIPLEDCAGPQGMAIGPNDQILEGCNAKLPEWAPEHRGP